MPNEESFFSRPESSGGGEKVAIRIVIEGRVQKVGLRNWIKQTAVKNKVYGWVRNKAAESVEAFFYGEKDVVSDIIALCHQGPSFAHVKRLKEYPQKNIENVPTEFMILPSV